MATIVECPHCYTRVGLSKEGKCPACGKNVTDRVGINSDLTRLEIGANDKLPSSCHRCDLPTERTVTIKRGVVRDREALFAFRIAMSLVLHPLNALAGIFTGPDGNRLSVKIRLPQCERCARRQKPEPDNVDFDRAQFSFIVHKGFRDKVRQLNGG